MYDSPCNIWELCPQTMLVNHSVINWQPWLTSYTLIVGDVDTCTGTHTIDNIRLEWISNALNNLYYVIENPRFIALETINEMSHSTILLLVTFEGWYFLLYTYCKLAHCLPEFHNMWPHLPKEVLYTHSLKAHFPSPFVSYINGLTAHVFNTVEG